MSPASNGSSVLLRFEHDNTVEICNGIMFDFYPGLPHIQFEHFQSEHIQSRQLLFFSNLGIIIRHSNNTRLHH